MKRVLLDVKVLEINDKGAILKDKKNNQYHWFSKNKNNYFTEINNDNWTTIKASLFKHPRYNYLMLRNIKIKKKKVI